MALINDKKNDYTQQSMPEIVRPDGTASNSSPQKITCTPAEHTQGLRRDNHTKHIKLSSRRVLKLFNLPNSKQDLKIRDPNILAYRMECVVSTKVEATKKKLMNLQLDSLSKIEKKAIADAIRNLEIIESLQASYCKDPKEFAKHLAIASGYISQQVEIPFTAMTNKNSDELELSMQAAAHMVCWLEHAAFSVGKFDGTDEAEDTPKSIAINMKAVNKKTNSILKKIKQIQKKNARTVVPWMETLQIPRNHSERKAKKQWVQDTLRLGLDSPICKELHLTPEIEQALKNLDSIDPQKQSSTFFVTEDYDTKDLKNWNQADALARLIAGRKTKGDMIHYYAQSQRSNKLFRLAMKILDGFGRQTLTGSNPESDLVYCERLTVAKAIDVCDDRFDKPLDKALQRLNSKSPEYAKLQQAKKVRDRLKKIDFNPEKNVNDEIRKAWWKENIIVFSQLDPHVPNWELLNIWPESSIFLSWLEQTFNELDALTLDEVENEQTTSDHSVVTETKSKHAHKKEVSQINREALAKQCNHDIDETNKILNEFKEHPPKRFTKTIIGFHRTEQWTDLGETETVVKRITNLANFSDNMSDQWYWQAKYWTENMGSNIESIASQVFDIDLNLESGFKHLTDEALQKKQILINNIGKWAQNIIYLCQTEHNCTEANLEAISNLEEAIKKST